MSTVMTRCQSLNRPICVSVMLLVMLTAGGNIVNAQIKSDRPRIFFAESPAILIRIDGDPVYRSVEGTHLERVINTKALIVRDSGGLHYLKVLDGWMEAFELTGEWLVSGVAPPGKEALQRVVDAKLVDVLDANGSQERGRSLEEQAPAIYVSLEPAELITTDGPPQYQTVDGTSLEYMANTNANVFKEPTDQELYVLISGRWFRAWTTDSPWQFIPSNELPADIAKIADTSLKKNVKPSNGGLAPQGQ
jgi:hypothetical protein